MKLFVEGGGDGKALRTACREAISSFLRKAGLEGRMPRTVASGSRIQAYEDFCTAVLNREPALLLVDSEAPIEAAHQTGAPEDWLPWAHLAGRVGDGWTCPNGATDRQCHLMVECMESWFLADRPSLQNFFGQDFAQNSLPAPERPIEDISKAQLFQALAHATRQCRTKGQYGKGEHSFKLLACIDPAKVIGASPWARRFVDETTRILEASRQS